MQNGNAQNATKPSSKKVFWANLGQKLPKNRVFWTLFKIVSLVFSDFWQEDKGQLVLKNAQKVTEPDFQKKIFVGKFGRKTA